MRKTRQPQRWDPYDSYDLVDLLVGDCIKVRVGGATNPQWRVYEGVFEDRGHAFISNGGGTAIDSVASPAQHIDFVHGGLTINLAGFSEIVYSPHCAKYDEKAAMLAVMDL